MSKKLTDTEKKKLGGMICELIIDLDKTIEEHATKMATLTKSDPEALAIHLRKKLLLHYYIDQNRFTEMYIDSL